MDDICCWNRPQSLLCTRHVNCNGNPRADHRPTDVTVTAALAPNEVIPDPLPRKCHSNSIVKMFYLKCEMLSPRGKKIAVWERASELCVCVCVSEHWVCLCAANCKQVRRCLLHYKPWSKYGPRSTRPIFYLRLIIVLFKSQCVCLCIVCAAAWNDCVSSCLSAFRMTSQICAISRNNNFDLPLVLVCWIPDVFVVRRHVSSSFFSRDLNQSAYTLGRTLAKSSPLCWLSTLPRKVRAVPFLPLFHSDRMEPNARREETPEREESNPSDVLWFYISCEWRWMNESISGIILRENSDPMCVWLRRAPAHKELGYCITASWVNRHTSDWLAGACSPSWIRLGSVLLTGSWRGSVCLCHAECHICSCASKRFTHTD